MCAPWARAAAGFFLAAALGSAWIASDASIAGAANPLVSQAAGRRAARAGLAVEHRSPPEPTLLPTSVQLPALAAPPIPPWADPLALRLRIAAAGPVALSGMELAAAGWDLATVDAANIALSRDGMPVPLGVLRRQRRIEEGLLRPDDRLIFSASAPDSPYDPHAVYWLQPRGVAARFEDGDGSVEAPSIRGELDGPGSSRAASSGASLVVGKHVLGRDDYFISHFRPPGGDRWLWDEALGADRERAIELPHSPPPAPDGRTHLALRLLGGTDDPDVALDHQVGLFLDGRRVAGARFGGRTAITVSATISNALWPAREEVNGGLTRPSLVLRNESERDSLSNIYVDHLHLHWDALAAGGVSIGSAADHAASVNGAEISGPSNEVDADGIPSADAALRFSTRATVSGMEPDPLRIAAMVAGRYQVLAHPPLDAPPIWWTIMAQAEGVGGTIGSVRGVDAGTMRSSTAEPRAEELRSAALTVEGVPPGSRVEVWRDDAEQAVVSIERNAPSNLWSASSHPPTGAHWVAIADASLLPALEPLAAWRERQGLRTLLVDIQDVWDEGAYGSPDPAALAALLAHAQREWRPAPHYVVLVGEANLDHRGADAERRGRPGPPDLLPTWTLDRADGRVQSSDMPYFSGGRDGMPLDGVALGRLPGASEEEVAAVVAKILRWEGASTGADASPRPLPPPPAPPPPPLPSRRALFVDDGSSATIGATARALAARLASRLSLTRLDGARWRAMGEDLPAAVRDELGTGAWLVAYLGHGNADTWAYWPGFGYLLHARDLEAREEEEAATAIGSDVSTLRPSNGLLLAMSCLNGAFDHPVKAGSLAERWLLAPGGGVAAWAPSGRARLPAQAALVDALLVAVASGPASGESRSGTHGSAAGLSSPIGDLVADARRAALAGRPERREASLGMVLFGDPAMPLEPGAGARIAARVDGTIYLPWAAR